MLLEHESLTVKFQKAFKKVIGDGEVMGQYQNTIAWPNANCL